MNNNGSKYLVNIANWENKIRKKNKPKEGIEIQPWSEIIEKD